VGSDAARKPDSLSPQKYARRKKSVKQGYNVQYWRN